MAGGCWQQHFQSWRVSVNAKTSLKHSPQFANFNCWIRFDPSVAFSGQVHWAIRWQLPRPSVGDARSAHRSRHRYAALWKRNSIWIQSQQVRKSPGWLIVCTWKRRWFACGSAIVARKRSESIHRARRVRRALAMAAEDYRGCQHCRRPCNSTSAWNRKRPTKRPTIKDC